MKIREFLKRARNPIEVKNRICVTQDEKPRVWFLKCVRNVRNPIEVIGFKKNRISVTQDPRVFEMCEKCEKSD
jgi:hypothetical protein